jgi:NADPH-dependent glutamate synthase beta subunit-like oxidoreductase/NAD(P)H-flavin reductase
MKLGFNASFEGLYAREGLVQLDADFIAEVKNTDAALHNRLVTARGNPDAVPAKEHSQLIIDLAPHAEDFIAQLFGIRGEIAALKEKHFALAPLYSCKRLFVQRKAAKAVPAEQAAVLDGELLARKLQPFFTGEASFEIAFARHVMVWLDTPEAHADNLQTATHYAAWALHSKEGQEKHKDGILFKMPHKLDPQHLIALETEVKDGITVLKLNDHHQRARNGFVLTDDGGTLTKALDEANYCIWCHNQGKDSCSKGMKEKEGGFKKSPLEITLAGCPLEEKISEMNFLKSEGVPLGALATIIIDNPMCAGTGHRICNDCMKSCIYQKQEPVNIPQTETRTLRDILELPYGFEIYSLLTRWNPLNIKRPLPKPDSGYKVLVAGLGPAGYTLSHYLMNDGHTVVGIDGLKIEPLPESISGVNAAGRPVPFTPIKDISELFEKLDERTLAGFGGVAEYGITVRWDKNFLKVIRLLLERRTQFAMLGGVRFGSTLTIESAFGLGFDHIALCMGAGKPTVIDMPGGLARGVRAASDFLMALQLTGAAKKDSIANLQLRLPVVVIGGGLTAIDTATESLAYYPIQVEKFLARYERLVQEKGEAAVRKRWSEQDKEIAEEFIAHAKALRAERTKPRPDIIGLLKSWGGSTMVYRRHLIDAPSYRLNHEEVEKALEEGITIAESLEPTEVEVDGFGHAKSILLKSRAGEVTSFPARTILVAAGTSPNTVLNREYPNHATLHGKYFQAVDDDGNPVTPERTAKPATPQVLMSVHHSGHAISFFGDLHPSFAGNVVKAMGSAKQGYPTVTRVLQKRAQNAAANGSEFLSRINVQLRPTIHTVVRLTPNIVEVVVKAPLAAERFEPGQFYRLQNFEANALKVDAPLPTTLAMEGLAMTGAWVDKEKGLISVIALEMGGSSDLCTHLQKGEPVILMGPTGTPTEIPDNETMMLVGGGLGNAVLFSIGARAREKGNKVLYFAGYKKAIDRYKIEEIEKAADVVIWCCDEDANFKPARPQDRAFHGNIVEAIVAYAEGRLGETSIKTHDVDHIIAIGSDRMMAAVAKARHHALKPHLKTDHAAIGSINSPMQCMMKEICAQCLQQHIDPKTGAVSYVYSCFNQDQPLDHVSWTFLNERLKQNNLQESVTAQWIDLCLASLGLRAKAA